MDLGRLSVNRKTGRESFRANGRALGISLLEFWQWSVSDLVSNATRGRLAEYVVAKGVGISTDGVRSEWDAFDLETATGIRIEVKSAAYVQSWHQTRLSSITFLTPPTRAWDPETNVQSREAKRQADLYVFALLAHADKATIDPLDLDQWRFYVLRTEVLNSRTRSQHSITLKTLEKLAGGSIGYSQLQEAVERAVDANVSRAV